MSNSLSEAQKRAMSKYKKNNVIKKTVEFNRNTDKDIIARIEAEPTFIGYIKRLIREDITKLST